MFTEEQLAQIQITLQSVEWVHAEQNDAPFCPMCYMDENGGHNPDCRLAKTLEFVNDAANQF